MTILGIDIDMYTFYVFLIAFVFLGVAEFILLCPMNKLGLWYLKKYSKVSVVCVEKIPETLEGKGLIINNKIKSLGTIRVIKDTLLLVPNKSVKPSLEVKISDISKMEVSTYIEFKRVQPLFELSVDGFERLAFSVDEVEPWRSLLANACLEKSKVEL